MSTGEIFTPEQMEDMQNTLKDEDLRNFLTISRTDYNTLAGMTDMNERIDFLKNQYGDSDDDR